MEKFLKAAKQIIDRDGQTLIEETDNEIFQLVVEEKDKYHFIQILPPTKQGGFRRERKMTDAYRDKIEQAIFDWLANYKDVTEKQVVLDIMSFRLLGGSNAGLRYHHNAWM